MIINILSQIVQYVLAAIFFIPLLLQAGSSVYVSLISTGGLTTNTESVSTLMNIGVLGLYVISTLLFLLVTTIISIIFKFAVWVKFVYVNTASAAFYDQALKEKIDQGELA